MRELDFTNLKFEQRVLDKIQELISYFDIGGGFLATYFYYKIDGITLEDNDLILSELVSQGILEKKYIFWCVKCSEYDNEMYSKDEYEKLDYVICPNCEEEYEDDEIKERKIFRERYVFIR